MLHNRYDIQDPDHLDAIIQENNHLNKVVQAQDSQLWDMEEKLGEAQLKLRWYPWIFMFVGATISTAIYAIMAAI